MNQFLRNKIVNDFISKYVIHNKYSLYPIFKCQLHNTKFALLFSLLILPITIFLHFIFENNWKLATSLKRNNYIYSFSYKDSEIQFHLHNYQTDLIEKLIFESAAFYESDILNDLSQYLDSSSVVLDVGANIGNHTIYFSKVIKVFHVYSFEPIEDTFQKLTKNVSLNNCKNVTLHKCALGAGQLFAEPDNMAFGNSGGMRIKYSENSKGIIVKPLDDFIFTDKIDLIKIDVEGFEEEVLIGGSNRIKTDKPIIFIEIHKKNYAIVESYLINQLNYRFEKIFGEDNYLFFPSNVKNLKVLP